MGASSKHIAGGGPCKLLWAARIVSFAPPIMLSFRVFWLVPHRDWQALLMLTVFFVLPAVVAWRWHLLGGTLILIPCGWFFICYICFPYEIERIEALRVWSPFLTPLLTSSILYFIVWWKGKKQEVKEAKGCRVGASRARGN
ncbi:MAG TPA: hypothetical protein VJ441_03245 [Dehalococcoidia bacterium]|nr:hypothetical protein [Dehalococcoidia bacterium]